MRRLREAGRWGGAPCRASARGTTNTSRRTRAPARTRERSRCSRGRTSRTGAARTNCRPPRRTVCTTVEVHMSRRGDQVVITNRKARHEYFVLESYEAGIVLRGAEVKSIRNGRANLQDAYARIDDGEV